MLELGHLPSLSAPADAFECGYRIYVTGDTLLVDEVRDIHARYREEKIDLMLLHLGGTILPEPNPPAFVSMDASQGLELLQLMEPDITIPIHYDDYDIFKSPLSEFKKTVGNAGLEEKVVYLERGEEYKFKVM
jgi:L-ascorbate metabolism protein UlaG (beta-lactamase superfamily)